MEPFANLKKHLFLLFVALFCIQASQAQTGVKAETKSRISVNVTEYNTKIWISDFPKNVSIVLFDEDYQLLSVMSSNDFGAGFINLPKSIHSRIYAKTVNGEVVVASLNAPKMEVEIAAAEPKESSKS